MTGPQPTSAAKPVARELGSSKVLHLQLADNLRERLRAGEWEAGSRLPTEAQLSTEYKVSRSTVRAALQLLENQGRTRTRHGIGTFVTRFGTEIRTGLQELESMSETIRSHGFEPEMQYHSVVLRPPSAVEAADLQCPADQPVLGLERAVLADGEVVAFSYDAIPAAVLPDGFGPRDSNGSLFWLLETWGHRPTTAVTNVHAAHGVEIGWGARPADGVYLLLAQTHYTAEALPVLVSRTYFLEGRFQFSLLRAR